MKKTGILLTILFVISFAFIIAGVSLMVMSTKKEMYNDDYIVSDIDSHRYSVKDLKPGEIKIGRDIKYNMQGVFEIVYKTYLGEIDNPNIIEDNTFLEIDDFFEKDFKLLTDKVIVNGNYVKFNNNVSTTDDHIKVQYLDNHINIKIPKELTTKSVTVKLYLQLIETEEKEYAISKEAYYSLVPSEENAFYDKKTLQSYIIEGNGSITLKKVTDK